MRRENAVSRTATNRSTSVHSNSATALNPSDALDLPLQFNAVFSLYGGANIFAEAFDVGGARRAGIDQEIGVLFADLRAAASYAPHAGFIDQLPSGKLLAIGAVRVLEGGAAGLFADRLTGFALGGDFGHTRADRIGGVCNALKGCVEKNQIRRQRVVAIGKGEL